MFDGVMDPAPESTKIRWQIEITGTITTDSYYPYTMVTDLGPRGGRQVWPRLPGVEVQGWCPLPLWTHNMTIYCLINSGNPHTIHCMCFSKLIAITFISTFFFTFLLANHTFCVLISCTRFTPFELYLGKGLHVCKICLFTNSIDHQYLNEDLC